MKWSFRLIDAGRFGRTINLTQSHCVPPFSRASMCFLTAGGFSRLRYVPHRCQPNMNEKFREIAPKLESLTDSQLEWIGAFVDQFGLPYEFVRDAQSDVITDNVLNGLGDLLRIHHAMSRQALSKAPFEYAFEKALNRSDISAQLAVSATNPGHDITIAGTRASLKTEAAAAIREHSIHISKWMEMGKGDWDPPNVQFPRFLSHLAGYERIFVLRCLKRINSRYHYELVEIPKALLLEVRKENVKPAASTRQATMPHYCEIRDADDRKKFSLYFDAGTERKLQIKDLRKDLCIVHATWRFESAPLQ